MRHDAHLTGNDKTILTMMAGMSAFLVAIPAFWIGAMTVRTNMQKAAVDAGVGVFLVDQYGKTAFEWRKCDE